MPKVIKVENPKHQTMKEIARDYLGYWVLISNYTDNPLGGVVRYYAKKNYDELWDVIMDMDKDFDMYGDCLIRSAVPNPAQLGGFGV